VADDQLILAVKTPAPEVNPAEVEMVVKVLCTVARWATAREIANTLGMQEGTTAERHVRAIASAAAPRIVSYPGSPGYKLWELCSVAEIDHCIDALEAQGRDMIKRATVYRLAYHRRFRGTPAASETSDLPLAR
jgi:hypothetical protein